MTSNKLSGVSTILSAISSITEFCANAITVVDYFAINKHEKRVQIGLDNITKALAVLNKNISRPLIDSNTGSSPENIELIHSDSDVSESEKIVLEGQTIPSVSNFELTQENLRKISVAVTKIMSKTVENPDLLRFETTETETKNADNLQTVNLSVSMSEGSFDLTDLIDQLKLTIGETDYKFSEILFNLLKVSQNPDFKPDNLPECLLAVSAEAKELTARLIGV
jgi:hypothetical protein